MWRFFLGRSERWEHRHVAVRIAVVVAAILLVLALLQSPWKHYAALVVWPLFAIFVVSIIYQWVRRWRELKRKQKSPSPLANHDA